MLDQGSLTVSDGAVFPFLAVLVGCYPFPVEFQLAAFKRADHIVETLVIWRRIEGLEELADNVIQVPGEIFVVVQGFERRGEIIDRRIESIPLFLDYVGHGNPPGRNYFSTTC